MWWEAYSLIWIFVVVFVIGLRLKFVPPHVLNGIEDNAERTDKV